MGQDPRSRDRFSIVFSPPPPQKPSLLQRARQLVFRIVVYAVLAQLALVAIVLTIIVAGAIFETVRNVEPPPSDIPDEMTDVHSLGINPGNGLLYAATPRGVYRVEAKDRALRIAEDYRNAAGFIVIGPDDFLAGGKPDFRDIISDFAPSVAGLVRTTDAGRSWQTVSLAGEALFTALSLVDGTLYAYEEPTESFMVSNDLGKTWETRGYLEQVIDFAAGPAARTDLIATTRGNGLFASSDGGLTWQPREGPDLRYVEWPQADQLWGVTRDGDVYGSRDAGLSWRAEGAAPGEVRAFYVTGEQLYVALEDGDSVLTSADRGQTWTLVYAPPPIP